MGEAVQSPAPNSPDVPVQSNLGLGGEGRPTIGASAEASPSAAQVIPTLDAVLHVTKIDQRIADVTSRMSQHLDECSSELVLITKQMAQVTARMGQSFEDFSNELLHITKLRDSSSLFSS